MKFMVFMIPGVYQPGKKIDPNFAPDLAAMEKMGKFNDELAKAAKITSLDGLQPLQKGARLSFSGGKPTLTDGPYVEAKEVIGGYWMVEFKSKQEAVECFKRCPAQDGDVIEIRPFFEVADFPEEIQQKIAKKRAEGK